MITNSHNYDLLKAFKTFVVKYTRPIKSLGLFSLVDTTHYLSHLHFCLIPATDNIFAFDRSTA